MNFCFFRRREGAASRSNLNIKIVLLIFALHLHSIGSKYIPSSSKKNDDLKMVFIVYRHGDRTPQRSYPKDPYRNYPWQGGFGALTPKGSLQMYTMGRTLRSKYKKLQPENRLYSKDNMRVLSSSYERAITSAQSLLAGFFPPEECENLLPIRWQPIAVNTIPLQDDYMLWQYDAPCPKYNAEYQKYLTDPDPGTDIYEYNQQHDWLYKYMTKESGANITESESATLVQDTLYCEDLNGFKLPAWTNRIYPGILQGVKERSYLLYTETPFMKYIRCSPLLTDIYELAKQKAIGNTTLNICMYSGHDTTLLNLMHGIGVAYQATITPEYGATFVLELHCSRNQECVVKIYYYFDTYQKKPKRLRVPNCPHPCTLSQFGRAISNSLIYNITQACGL